MCSLAVISALLFSILTLAPAYVSAGESDGTTAMGTPLLRGDSTTFQYPAGSTIVPTGSLQINLRNAYQHMFWRIYQFSKTEWAASALVYDGVTYPPGTFLSREVPFGNFTHTYAETSFDVQSAYSLKGIGIALFHSVVKDSRGQAVTWESAYFESIFNSYLGGDYFDAISEAQISDGSVRNYGMLILPTVTKGYVNSVIAELGTSGLTKLREFVQAGGTLYAQGDSTYIAEAAGLVPPGTVVLDKRVTAVQNSGGLSVRQPDSPLAYSWTSSDMYVLDDPLLHASDARYVVAEYSSNLTDGTQLGTPAIMAVPEGYGNVVLVSGHPSEKIEHFPVVLDAILFAMSERADVRSSARQTYSDAVPWYMIPALEANVTIEVTGTFMNFWNAPIEGVVVLDWVRPGFWVDKTTIYPTPTEVTQDSNGTWVNWTFDAPQGEFQYGYIVKTYNGTVQNRWTQVAGTWAAWFQDPITGKPVRRSSDSRWFFAVMPAHLLGDRDIELDSIYPLPASGAYFDVALPLENKEETDALETTIVDIVPLKSPVVDVADQTRIPGAFGNTNFGTNNPVYANLTIYFYDNPNYPLPDGVADSSVTFSVGDADATYVYNATGTPIELPAKKLTWTIGTIRAYDYKEPMIRYGLFVQEEYKRTVSFLSDPIAGSVVLNAGGGSVYTTLGSHCVPYHEYLEYGVVYMPEAPEMPRVDYKDVWEREHTLDLRTTFFDMLPFPPGEQHAVSTKTFEVLVDGERTLEYPMDKDAQLHFMIKSWNSYPPYDPVNYPYHSDMTKNETLVREVIPKGVGYRIVYDHSEFNDKTELADIVETDASTILYFKQDLNASEKEVIDVYANLKNIDHEEGAMKVNDGTRFVYHQISAGPSRYEVLDNHVQAVFGVQNNIELTNTVAPVSISTYGDNVYQTLKVTDPKEPQELQDPYIKSYGFGDISATTYVGGRINKTLLYSKLEPSEKTLVRIEVSNNLGYDLTNVRVVPEAQSCISVEPAIFDIPPIWYDFPFLNVTDIWDAWKGVYYFWVTAEQCVERGKVYQVNFTLQGDNVPADFQIPAALVGIKDLSGHVYMTYGKATDISVEQDVPTYVNVTDARIANESEKADFEYLLATNDKVGAGQLFDSLRQIGFVKSESGDVINVDYQLPSYAQTMPWYDNGAESFTFYVISRSVVTTDVSGANLLTHKPKVVYTDHFGEMKTDQGDEQTVYAHGPVVTVQPRVDDIVANGRTQDHLVPGTLNTIHATIYVSNVGDDIAQNVIVTAVLPQTVTFQTSSPAPASVTGTIIKWSLGDIAPYSQSSVTLTLSITTPTLGNSSELITLIETVQPELMHMYLQQQVTGAMLGPPALNALNAPSVDLPGGQTLDQIGVVLLLTGAIVLIVAVVAALLWRKKKKEAVPVENQQSPLPR